MKAEEQYWLAFERLKSNTPRILPIGTPVSQNNVAKEAGNDPSALRKSRFPVLIAEIQKYVDSLEHNKALSNSKQAAIRRKHNRSLSERLEDSNRQRAALVSQLLEADALILELRGRVGELERKAVVSNVVSISSRGLV
jgi:hypothetical protein